MNEVLKTLKINFNNYQIYQPETINVKDSKTYRIMV